MHLPALPRRTSRGKTGIDSCCAARSGNRPGAGRRVDLNSESGDPEESRESFSVAARMESFRHAFSGIAGLFRSEHNAWIHFVATVAAIVLAWVFRVDRSEWMAIVLAIALVWAAEAVNTAVEVLCDILSPNHDPRIKRVKDLAAGAVLLSALGALGVGLLVFVPRLLTVIGS